MPAITQEGKSSAAGTGPDAMTHINRASEYLAKSPQISLKAETCQELLVPATIVNKQPYFPCQGITCQPVFQNGITVSTTVKIQPGPEGCRASPSPLSYPEQPTTRTQRP